MQKIRTVKGMKDLFGDEFINHQELNETFSKLCDSFNYEGIKTPILEYAEIFLRSLGETSDIVSKEIYNFVDKGDEHLVLRPEGTAAIVRAFISNSFSQKLVNKYYYFGPMFRRERPQSGRLRQFNQLGVEYFGNQNYLADLEVIMIANKFIEKIGLKKSVKLELNSLGNESSRKKYVEALHAYFKKRKNDLSEDSLKRLEKNPLRILDSKNLGDQKIIKDSPKIQSFYDEESSKFFDSLINGLNIMGIKYELNSNLVRGLDYYSHTAFEYRTAENKGQNTLLAGGRYDGLVRMLGGNDSTGVGWAAGIERIILSLTAQKYKSKKLVSIFSDSNELDLEILKIMKNINLKKHIAINFLNSGNFKKKLSKANKINSDVCIIISEEEWKENKLIWKDLKKETHELLPVEKLEQLLNEKIKY